jgi:tetratricopeptide (TPR) repeat protein/predicted Ser/Thr protein kinase
VSGPSPVEVDQGRTPWPSDDGQGPVPPRSGALDPGEVLGRYVVLYRLGTGGMGVVYAAYDPELDRKVALKLLRRGSSDPVRRRRARERLAREARAMARLTHPNVITVHDVAVYEGRVFMAMEYVDGVTLARGLSGDGMHWKKVVEIMIAAGKGLAAAHDAGLVHRDFKPDNVMLAKDGRVLVMDFGLARALEADPGERSMRGPTGDPEASPARSTARPSIVASRDPGSNLAGTPAYMAPEQRAGEPADARVDQFSFCVSLYEALYRQRPFRGGEPEEIARRIEAGEIEEPPAQSKVPAWVRAVVMRGLSRDPALRYESMNDLLAALDRKPAARRKKWLLGAGAGAVIGGGIAALALGLVTPDPCAGASERLHGAWDSDRSSAIEKAFLAVDRPYADDAWTRVSSSLSTYADEWSRMHRDACEANRVRGEQSDDLFDLRMECLARRRQELQALTDLFMEADPALVAVGVDATGRLSPVTVCADTELLRTPVPLPDDHALRSRIESARATLAQAKAQQDAGRYDRGLGIVESVVAETRDIGHDPLLAEALMQEGRLQYLTGDAEASARTLREAAFVAARGKHDEVVARAWTALLMTQAVGLGRSDESSDALADVAGAAVERAGGSAELRAELATARGALRNMQGRFDRAEVDFEEALDHQRQAHGEAHPSLGRFYNNLAVAVAEQGDLERSQGYLERALEIQERNLGPDHPNVAVFLGNLALIRAERGEEEQALTMLERAVDIWRRGVTGDHPQLAQALVNLGSIRVRLDDFERGEAAMREGVAIEERLHAEHPTLAMGLLTLGSLLAERGRADEGLALLERGRAMLETTRGADHPDRVFGQALIGIAHLARGDAAAAIPDLEAAWARREDADSLAARSELPRIGLGLARALRDTGSDPARAEAVARDALQRLDELPRTRANRRQQQEIEDWLAGIPAR